MTAITTKAFKNMVNGDTSRLMIVIDISEADVSLVRKAGRHSGMVSPKRKLQLCKCDSSFDKFIFSCFALSQRFPRTPNCFLVISILIVA